MNRTKNVHANPKHTNYYALVHGGGPRKITKKITRKCTFFEGEEEERNKYSLFASNDDLEINEKLTTKRKTKAFTRNTGK